MLSAEPVPRCRERGHADGALAPVPASAWPSAARTSCRGPGGWLPLSLPPARR